ncbi:CRC domain-containing protein, partial [Cynara cardunculus var. scolymus]
MDGNQNSFFCSYCDCFAARFYCDKHCSCQGCYNIPDYEATVNMTREQIELRNPLAFTPKIHYLEYGDRFVGEHIKGCNCRKSMCQSKYCECYRAKVGCSGGCRCEGCRN